MAQQGSARLSSVYVGVNPLAWGWTRLIAQHSFPVLPPVHDRDSVSRWYVWEAAVKCVCHQSSARTGPNDLGVWLRTFLLGVLQGQRFNSLYGHVYLCIYIHRYIYSHFNRARLGKARLSKAQ